MARRGGGAQAAAVLVAALAALLLQHPRGARGAAVAAPARLRTVGGRLLDAHGRARVYHGISMVRKGTPWYHPRLASGEAATAARMQALGLNSVRLGMMWTGAQPSADGGFNETYYQEVSREVAELRRHGIETLLDVHQDLLSARFCLYDGFPPWVIDKSVSRHTFPWPLKGNCSSRFWEDNAFPEATGQAYQDFYDNRNGMRDDFVRFWNHTASFFRDIEGVLGYELVNEPYAGNMYSDPLIMLPGVAGSKNLQPLYDAVGAVVRAADPSTPIFYEPVTWGMVFDGKIAGSGLTQVPGGPEYADRSVLSYHYYCSSFVPSWPGKPDWVHRVVCDDAVGALMFESIDADVKHLGGASWLTEFGDCGSFDESGSAECELIVGRCEERFESFHVWAYTSDEAGDFAPTDAWTDVFSTVYARAIAGEPISTKFDRASRHFSLCFVPNATIPAAAPTEIFASAKLHYPEGIAMQLDDPDGALGEARVEGDVVLLPNSGRSQGKQEACVHLSPKQTSHATTKLGSV